MTLYKWSKTAASNGNADITCPFPEGMAASALNDGTRGMMAAIAKYRDDIAGAIVTTGTATAYAVLSNQGFDSFADMDGKVIAFSPHVTNGANGSSLNVDLLGVKPILTAPGVGLQGGVLIQGTPYLALYNNTDGAFYLQGFFGNPFNIPLAGGLDYWGPTAPNSSFAFPVGQAISRTTYATLFALIGGAYGGGDGSTTFNLPDKRGKVSAALDPAGVALTSFSINPNANTLGAVGGAQGHSLALAELPTGITSAVSVTSISVSGSISGSTSSVVVGGSGIAANAGNGFANGSASVSGSFSGSGSGSGSATSNNTGGQPHVMLQPTIMCNYIMRIL